LIVIAHYAKIGGLLGQELNKTFLGGIDVLVFIDYQVPERAVDAIEDTRNFQRSDRLRDDLAVGEETIPVQHFEVAFEALAERCPFKISRVYQLVPDDVDILDELRDGLFAEFEKTQVRELAIQEAGVPVLVEDIVIAILGNVVLQQAEAIGMDGADEQRPEAVEECRPHCLFNASGDAMLELGSCPLRKREGNDGGRLCSFRNEAGDAPGYGLGLPGTRAGEDLEMTIAVGNDLLLLLSERDRASFSHLSWPRRNCISLGSASDDICRECGMSKSGTRFGSVKRLIGRRPVTHPRR
jgi:hypothetical protein